MQIVANRPLPMTEFPEQKSYDPGRLLAYLKQMLDLKTDIALSKALRISHQLLGAIREKNWQLPVRYRCACRRSANSVLLN